MSKTITMEIGWTEDGDEITHDFPAKTEPTECHVCHGSGTTVADGLKGLDFSPEELQRNGDWHDYVEGKGIWRPVRCSKCSGQGCFMETSIDIVKAEEHHSKELEMMYEHQQEKSDCERESQAIMWGESGGTCGSPY